MQADFRKKTDYYTSKDGRPHTTYNMEEVKKATIDLVYIILLI